MALWSWIFVSRTDTRAHICIYIYIHINPSIHPSHPIHPSIHTYIHTCVYIYICNMHIYIYTYNHRHRTSKFVPPQILSWTPGYQPVFSSTCKVVLYTVVYGFKIMLFKPSCTNFYNSTSEWEGAQGAPQVCCTSSGPCSSSWFWTWEIPGRARPT